MIAIITARKESKRLPNKNMMKINGKTLIEYAIDSVINSTNIDYIIVTTDYNIEDIIRKYEYKLLKWHKRPSSLCGDYTTSQEIVDDIINKYKSDYYILLQPTSPLRTQYDVDKSIEIYHSSKCEVLMTVVETEQGTYKNNGAICIFKDNIWSNSRILYVMDKNKSIDIDTMEDFRLAESRLNEEGVFN